MKKFIFIALILSGCTGGIENKNIGTAKPSNNTISYYDEQYIDKYSWLRDKDFPTVNDPEILSFIADENRVSNNYFQENKELLTTVFNEIKSRKPVRKSLPYEDNNYIYNSKYLNNAKYLTHYITDKKTKEVTLLLDE
jgi:oligopeptidase B